MVRKKKRSFFDDLINRIFGDVEDLIPDGFIGGAGGYSIEVHTTPEGTEVRAKVYGNVDKDALKRQLESMYPGAKIVIEGEESVTEEEPLIRRIDEESVANHEEKVAGKKVSITFREGKPVIEKSGSSDIKVIKVEKVERIDEDQKDEGAH